MQPSSCNRRTAQAIESKADIQHNHATRQPEQDGCTGNRIYGFTSNATWCQEASSAHRTSQQRAVGPIAGAAISVGLKPAEAEASPCCITTAYRYVCWGDMALWARTSSSNGSTASGDSIGSLEPRCNASGIIGTSLDSFDRLTSGRATGRSDTSLLLGEPVA